MRFILASASPARLATLRAAGVQPEVIVSGVDEDALSASTAAELVQLLANRKAAAVAEAIDGSALVLGCDSLLQLDEQILGKPGTVQEATRRWQRMRGRTAYLHTGHCLIETGPAETRQAQATGTTEVRFADVSDAEIAAYLATGEPLQVAGAFTIDGAGGWFIESIVGDYHNVVGLSLPLLRTLLAQLGHAVSDLPAGSAAGGVKQRR